MNSKKGITFSIAAIAAVTLVFAATPLIVAYVQSHEAQAMPFFGMHRNFFGFHNRFFGFHNRFFGGGPFFGGFGGWGGWGGGCGGCGGCF